MTFALTTLTWLLTTLAVTTAPAEEVLYNGIKLPKQWPPRVEQRTRKPLPAPYLEHPPAVISIDVGRQLFVDDFLIERTTLKRNFHRPRYISDNPVLKADKPWEQEAHGPRAGPVAMPFSDGVWFDPQDKLFKLWYLADYGNRHLCYATSRDGIHWEKPSLDVVPGTNVVFLKPGDARVVWLNLDEKDPARRFTLIITRGGDDIVGPDQKWHGSKGVMHVHFSPDGIHWGEEASKGGPSGDRNSAFYNPFRKLWVFSIRDCSPAIGSERPERSRRYWESPDLIANLPWKYREATMWVGADELDPFGPRKSAVPELYNLDAVAYESVMVGLFAILRDAEDMKQWRPKINELSVGFSRDGFHWHRPDRLPFLPVSEEKLAWNWGNVQSAGGCFLVVGDQLYFYVSGRTGDGPHFQDAGGSTGLATLRRDGFASMDSDDVVGTLETRPVHFSGKHLFVNVDNDGGNLRAEVLDQQGKVIEPFRLENCTPVSLDKTCAEIRWRGAQDLSAVSGKPVRIRFSLADGSLYAFWVSADSSGASRGFVAAGGPGFTGSTDTVGQNKN